MDTMIVEPDAGRTPAAEVLVAQGSEQAGCPGEGEDGRNLAASTTVALRRRQIALLALLVAIGRTVFNANRTSFSLAPDELATAGMARFLTGHHFDMLAANTYRPGFSILIAPIFTVVSDPEWLVRLSLAVNAALGGLAVCWLVPILRRLTDLSGRGVLLSSGALALMPASLEASAHLWAEPLVTLTFLATLHAVLQFYDAPTFRWGIVAVLWSVAGFTSHGRLLALVGLAGVAVVGRSLAGRRLRLALVVSGVAVGAAVASSRLQDWVIGNVWHFAGDHNTSVTIVDRLGDPLQVLDSAIGQVWYQLCASALLFGLGVVELTRRVRCRRGPEAQRDAIIVLGLTLPLMAVSMVFMSDVVRADHVIYGRYNDAIMWPVLGLGAAWLFQGRLADSVYRGRFIMVTVATGTVALGLLLRQLHYVQFRVAGVEAMIAGLVPIVGGGAVNVALATAVALAVFASLAGASKLDSHRSLVVVVVVLGLLLTAGARLWVINEPYTNSFAATSSVLEIRDLAQAPPPGEAIGVSIMPNEYRPDLTTRGQVFRALGYQWYLPEYEFVFDNGPSDDVGPYVFAVTNDALLTREGGTILWSDPAGGMALWLEPGPDN